MNNPRRQLGTFYHDGDKWIRKERPNIKVYGRTIEPDNPMYDAVDTYASTKEYEEITQN